MGAQKVVQTPLQIALQRMDAALKNPNLTPDQRYAIAAPFSHLLE